MKRTWSELVELEPLLADLLAEINRVNGNSPNFCANRLWYGPRGYRRRMEKLVGWGAANKALRTITDYDLAYRVLYRALPDCKHEGGVC